MRFFSPAFVPAAAARASTRRRNAAYLVLAMGAATLFGGTVTLAADKDGSGAESGAAPVETTGVSGAETPEAQTKEAPAISTQEADHHRRTDSKGHKTGSKAHKGGATGDVDSEIIVEGKQPQAQQKCVPVQATGSRLRKTVCTTVAQQKANDKNSEQQAQDYLRRLSQQGSLAPANPSPFIQSGLP